MVRLALGFTLLFTSAASASWFAADSEDLRHEVFEYCQYLAMDKVEKNYACFGENLLLYGLGSSTCMSGDAGQEMRTEAGAILEGVLGTEDMKAGIVEFYRVFMLPEKHDKDLLLSMTTYFIKDRLSYESENGHYNLQLRDFKIRFPASPMPLSQEDCNKIKLFLAWLRFRLDNFHAQFEHSILMVFALSNFPGAEKEIGEDGEKKLQEVTEALKSALKQNHRNVETEFCGFLMLRGKKEELLVMEVAAATDPAKKAELEKELKFHQLITHMLLHGWMAVSDITPNNGKVSLTGLDGKTHVYDVPEN